MLNKKIATVLIVLTLGISVFNWVNKLSKKNELNNVSITELDIEKLQINKDLPDIKDTLSDYDVDLKTKTINYPIMKFFNYVNSKEYDKILIFPEYIDFFSSSNVMFNKYDNLENVFYEIVSTEKINNIYFLNINFKEESSDKVYNRTFATDGTHVVDESFIRIEDLDILTGRDDYSISVKGRTIYKDKEVYKVKVINNGLNTLTINHDMYGFYALIDLNKHYHKLLQGSSDYDILPNGESTYYVEIGGRGVQYLYINIGGDNVKIMGN